jgi:hypothetical protein
MAELSTLPELGAIHGVIAQAQVGRNRGTHRRTILQASALNRYFGIVKVMPSK